LERLEALQAELSSQYPKQKIHTIALDVRKREAVFGAIASLPSGLNEIDVLVNNAGLVIGVDKLADVSEEAIETMLDTNVKGLVFITQAVLPGMKERQRGHILNVGSVSGEDQLSIVKNEQGSLNETPFFTLDSFNYRKASLFRRWYLLW